MLAMNQTYARGPTRDNLHSAMHLLNDSSNGEIKIEHGVPSFSDENIALEQIFEGDAQRIPLQYHKLVARCLSSYAKEIKNSETWNSPIAKALNGIDCDKVVLRPALNFRFDRGGPAVIMLLGKCYGRHQLLEKSETLFAIQLKSFTLPEYDLGILGNCDLSNGAKRAQREIATVGKEERKLLADRQTQKTRTPSQVASPTDYKASSADTVVDPELEKALSSYYN